MHYINSDAIEMILSKETPDDEDLEDERFFLIKKCVFYVFPNYQQNRFLEIY